MKKRILFYLLTLVVICSSASAYSITVHAKKNITGSVSSGTKKKLKTIANKFDTMSAYYLEYINTNAGAHKTFNFSKESHRRFFIKYSDNSGLVSSPSKRVTYSKQLFGKSVSKSTPVISGDWGCDYPVCSLNQIYKISSKKYAFTCNLYMLDDSETPVIKRLIGTQTFYLTKNSKAKYGFYVTKLVLNGV